ncbi:hypothetical protein, partial [Burkholderia sola]|uniref:hypothetical protein n=1 Tax=Burkholderia sola TaxID=2843302 RepID=UPI001C0A7F29
REAGQCDQCNGFHRDHLPNERDERSPYARITPRAPTIKNQESRIKNQESRIKNQESEIRNQESAGGPRRPGDVN